jgi:hypothetical protein
MAIQRRRRALASSRTISFQQSFIKNGRTFCHILQNKWHVLGCFMRKPFAVDFFFWWMSGIERLLDFFGCFGGVLLKFKKVLTIEGGLT